MTLGVTLPLAVRLVAAAGACVLLAGCGRGDAPVVGDEPITPPAIAAITQEHVDLGEPTRISETGVYTREIGAKSPDAWLEYGDVSLNVFVAPTRDSPMVCVEPTFFDECVDDTIDGHHVMIAWQEREPEEDPGVVYVIDRRQGEDVGVAVGGASITDDPRDLDLGVPLADLAALVTDPRLSLTTSQSVVDLGGVAGAAPTVPVVLGSLDRRDEAVRGRP